MDMSYSYQNLVRDLGNEFEQIRAQAPNLMRLVGPADRPARQQKHEWLEDVLRPQQVLLAAAVLVGDNSLTVPDSSKLKVGQVWAADGSEEVIYITGITDATHVAVQRGYGGSTAEAIADGETLRLVSTPKLQGTDPGDDKGQEPIPAWNACQIFDRTAKISRSAQAVQIYGLDDALNYQVGIQMDQLTREMNNSLIYGRRVEAANNVPGMAGGLIQFLNLGGNVTDAAGAKLTPALLNDLIEKVVTAGGAPDTIVCNTFNARVITAMNTLTNNYTVFQDSQVAGNQVRQFVNDLPMGIIANIVVDINFPRDTVMVLDSSRLKHANLNGRHLQDEDARLPGADYAARRLLCECTFEIRNAGQAHGMLKNLQKA